MNDTPKRGTIWFNHATQDFYIVGGTTGKFDRLINLTTGDMWSATSTFGRSRHEFSFAAESLQALIPVLRNAQLAS